MVETLTYLPVLVGAQDTRHFNASVLREHKHKKERSSHSQILEGRGKKRNILTNNRIIEFLKNKRRRKG